MGCKGVFIIPNHAFKKLSFYFILHFFLFLIFFFLILSPECILSYFMQNREHFVQRDCENHWNALQICIMCGNSRNDNHNTIENSSIVKKLTVPYQIRRKPVSSIKPQSDYLSFVSAWIRRPTPGDSQWLCGPRWEFFWCSRAANSGVLGRIWRKFELVRDIMVVLVTCKYEEDLIKNEGARVLTRFSLIIALWELSVAMETRVPSRSGPKPQWCFR